MVFHNEDGNPARANIKQALGYLKDGDGDGNSQPHKGVKASANSDVMYFFTSAQDGDPSQDDVRLCLDDDLKKAQDHSQRQALGGYLKGDGTKHILPKFLFTHDLQKSDDIIVQQIRSSDNLADLFTKASLYKL
ncbi:hypothetical protein Tco_1042880 [Tanacetum coccineum]|uniref:Uncharacterized protein n=1 Tax=Tanacetum coccineum TaxID=301880 RepID=A0ABQ5GLQ2_9ASTR